MAGSIFYGSNGAETLTGGHGDDSLYGYDGADLLDGGGGNDTLHSDYWMVGATGYNDTLIGGDGNDVLYAYGGDDSLDGGAGADTLNGGSGNDTLSGGTGEDVLWGDAGDDVYVVTDLLDRILDSGGTDTAIVSVRGYIPTSNIENTVLTGDGSLAPLSIQALYGGSRWGDFSSRGTPYTLTYGWLQSAGNRNVAGFRQFNDAEKDVAEQALRNWSDVSNITFVESADAESANLQFLACQLDWGGGMAYYPSPAGSTIYIDADLGSYGWETQAHEIGHALGLKHPGDYDVSAGHGTSPFLPVSEDSRTNTIMSYYGSSTGGLGVYDIAAIQYLYGPNPTVRSGDDTYTLTAEVAGQYIWDGGGNDTVSAAGNSRAVTIDLRDGGWGWFGAQTSSFLDSNQFFIGYGSVIENAIGGLGDDSLVGGEGNNGLWGGTGTDTLIGGSGNDTLAGQGGDDSIDGGAGVDTAIYQGALSDYEITVSGNMTRVQYLNGGGDDTDVLTNVEYLQFSDQVVRSPTLLSVTTTSVKMNEGNSGMTAFTFTVARTGDTSGTSSAVWTVAGTGSNGANAADFGGKLPSGTVSFAAGETVQTIAVPVSGDTTVEPDETFGVTLASPTGASIITASATGTITNDDAVLAITALAAANAEGNSGTGAFTFTVTRTGDVSGTSSASWTVGGTGSNAANAADFGGRLPSGTVSFAAGETVQTIAVPVSGDTTVEPDEAFSVTLANPAGASIITASATGTITNDDAALAITALAAANAEGNSGTIAFTFVVTRAGDTSGASSASWAVTGTGSNTANAADFGGTLPSGTVDFAAGETAKIITVSVTGDTTVEPDETFGVTLASPTGASVTTASATSTITNDDAVLAITALAAANAEGNSGTGAFTFTVTRTGDVSGTSSASWTVGGTGSNAANAADFGGALPSGTVSFTAGETVQTITVPVTGDTMVEPDETFSVTLANPAGASIITDSSTGTITNDDSAAALTLVALAAANAEGNSGTTAFAFTVTRTGDVSGLSSAFWAVTGTGNNAADETDFGGTLPSGTVSFAAGETVQTITVPVSGDTTVESDETFGVTLANPTGASITTARATGTIANDDIDATRRLSVTSGGVSRDVEMQTYSGPVAWLHNMYTGTDDNEAMRGTDLADFINTRSGDDAIDGGKGDDVLDGGLGSNFLTGGTGNDTFFVDGRGGGITWSTVTDLEKGEWITAWGWRDGVSRLTWEEMSGAEGAKGATAHIDLDANNSIDMSVTITGKSSGSVFFTTGNVGGDSYLAFSLK